MLYIFQLVNVRLLVLLPCPRINRSLFLIPPESTEERERSEREREMKEGSSSGGGAFAGGSDPRQPSTAKPYAPPKLSPQDLPIDYAGFLAVVFGVVGVMLRVRNHVTLSDLNLISE